MVDILGAETITGAAIEVVSGTAIAATQKVNLISNGLDVTTGYKRSEILCGNAGRNNPKKGVDTLAGAIVEEWSYDQQSVLLEQFFGAYTPQVLLVPGFYDIVSRTTQTMTIASNMHDAVVYEASGVSTDALTITGTPANDIQLSCAALGGVRTVTGGVNTAATLALLPLQGLSVRFEEMVMRFGDLADVLGIADEIKVNQFTLTISRNGKVDEVNQETTLGFAENGKRDVVLAFTLPRYQTQQFITFKESQTRVQADMIFTQLNGTATKTIKLPAGNVFSAPSLISGPDLQPTTITCEFTLNPGENAFTDFVFPNEVRILEAA